MNYLKRIAISLTLVFLFFNRISVAQETVKYQDIYNQIKEIEIDTSKIYMADGLVLNRELLKLEFKKGKIFFCKPVNGKMHFAVFLGDGTYYYEPNNKIESEHLYRFYKERKLSGNLESLLISFSDSTYAEITKKCPKSVNYNSDIGSAGRVLSKNIGYMVFDHSSYYPTNQMKSILENDDNGFFYAQFKDIKGKILQYEIDPYSEESISLSYCHSQIFKKYSETINSLKLNNTKAENRLKDTDFIRISSYRINSTIGSQLFFTASVSADFTPNFPNQKWLCFNLHEELKVDSIKINGKKNDNFFKDEYSSILWINTKTSLELNKPYTIDFYYKGRIMERDTDGWVYNKSYDYWYPRIYSKDKADYEMVFKYPSKMKLGAVGELVETKEEDDCTISKWVTKKPVKHVSFNIGIFKELKVDEKDLPGITVFNYENGHSGASSSMNELVGEEVQNSMKFYTYLFGKIDINRIYVTEIAALMGEAFEGLVNFSVLAFHNDATDGSTEAFRAHEVAHQWWGIGVGYNTYHDQWLSEGFAEYSSLMYLQAKTKDNQKFLDRLIKYKERILDNRKYLFETGVEAGPIWLGARTAGYETPNDYDLIIYKKGAWVLHMLRMLMIDLKTMKEDAFNNMMREFYSTYKGENPTTEDFRMMVEKHIGRDMKWFFNQWVYGTFVPGINYGYKIQEENSKYRVIIKASIPDATPDYQVYVPVLVKFDDNKFVRLRVALKGENSSVSLPLLPLKPQEIIFNDLESVLCSVSKSDYEDMKF